MSDLSEFRQLLKNASDEQVFGIWQKEYEAGRHAQAELAISEAERRGLDHIERRVAVRRKVKEAQDE